VAASRPAAEPASSPVPIALAAAALAVAGIGLAFRRRFVLSGVAIAVAAVVGGASMARSTPAVTVAEAASLSAYDQGAALFLAKGCVVCHMNRDLVDSESFALSIGPDLSQYSNDPAFLLGWLADPAAVRAGAQMPDLELSAEEIESLIAFLNGEGGA
jgi:mono/diheme cytochrome c family protein